jgi:hypothetical protein
MNKLLAATILAAVVLVAEVCVLESQNKQRVVAVYEFGCLIDVHKNEKTYVEFPVDEYGREDRQHGKVVAPVATLPPQGNGGTPSVCAIVKIVH